MSPFCKGHCADKPRLSRGGFFFFFCSPGVPPSPKWLCYPPISLQKLNRQEKLFFFFQPTPLHPHPIRFFFLLHAVWTIWLCSGCIPVAHSLPVPRVGPGTVDPENTGSHSAPARCCCGGWVLAGEAEKRTEYTWGGCATSLIPGLRDKGSLEKAPGGRVTPTPSLQEFKR